MKRFLSSAVFAAGLAFGGSAVHADVHPGVQGLNDLLIQKGIVTKEEVEAQAKKHSLNITGYIQVQGMVTENDAGKGNDDGFKVRRAKLAASGNAYENVKFKFEVDFVADSGKPRLDDAFIEDDHLPYFIGKVGQFKVPFSLEQLTSDTEILTIERSEAVNQITPARDRGISFSGDVAGGMVNYSIGAFNGGVAGTASTYSIGSYQNAGLNKSNDNDRLMYAGRLVVKPVEWASIGLNGLTSTDGTGSTEVDRKAYGVELQVKNPKRGCTLQGEYMKQSLEETGADVNSDGFYIQAGHFVVPKHLEVAVKYEEYDADNDVTNKDDIKWTTVGLNFYIYGHDAKLMANYIFKNEEKNSYDNDTFLAQVQLRF